MTSNGSGYASPAIVTITGSVGTGTTAVATSIVGAGQSISSIRIVNPGVGYTVSPTVTIAPPAVLVGFGTYLYNEVVTGSNSGTTARVKSWDADTKILKVSFVDNATNKGFYPGETIVGSASSAIYSVQSYDRWDLYDKYSENIEIENEADTFIDFSQSNPFGTY